MKIAVNAVNLKSAGGLTVGLNFIKEISLRHANIYLEVFAPGGVGYEEYDSDRIKIRIIPKKMESPFWRLVLDYFWLKNQIEKIKPDVVFTMGNIPIPITKIKQGVLFMYPYATYPGDKDFWKRLSTISRIDYRLRNLLFKSRLKFASAIYPQSESSKKRLSKYYNLLPEQMHIVPMAYSTIGLTDSNSVDLSMLNGRFKLVCLARYWVHKNIEILIKVAKIIKREGIKVNIIITCDESHHENVSLINNKIIQEDISDVIFNIGYVPINKVPSLYKQVDGLILPSLLESFSATYVDAMYFEKVILTSDRDFARDVCGESAIYFDPLSATDIFEKIRYLYMDNSLQSELIRKGKLRSETMPNWESVGKMYIENLKLLISTQPAK